MTLLDSHLALISTSARAIGDLEIFTNALLGQHEITTLIRDTEPHERSLFTVDPKLSNNTKAVILQKATVNTESSNRRKTISQPPQRQGSAVAKVLGNDMLQKIQQSSRRPGQSRGVDVEVLLQAAEKLCAVYPVNGAKERISKLRTRHTQVTESVSHLEGLVLQQQAKITRFNNKGGYNDSPDNEDSVLQENEAMPQSTEFDLRAEEEEIKELEAKKKALEDRVAGIEKDLGGLLQ